MRAQNVALAAIEAAGRQWALDPSEMNFFEQHGARPRTGD